MSIKKVLWKVPEDVIFLQTIRQDILQRSDFNIRHHVVITVNKNELQENIERNISIRQEYTIINIFVEAFYGTKYETDR